MIDRPRPPIKAGEYEVAGACLPMQALVELLQSGKVVQRRLTVAEGLTTAEVLELVRKTEALAGEITLDARRRATCCRRPIYYSRDDTRDGAAVAHEGGDGEDARRGVAQARAPGLPLASRREALIAGLDHREGDGDAGRAAEGGGGLHQPAARRHEAARAIRR